MEPAGKTIVTVSATVSAPVEKVWKSWTEPEHIVQWNSPSEEWHTTTATNDLTVGGAFSSRMEAKDGSMGFDFAGIYDDVKENELITYTLGDGRRVEIFFSADGDQTHVSESFEAEDVHPVEFQQGGWQAIMDSFKKHTEGL